MPSPLMLNFGSRRVWLGPIDGMATMLAVAELVAQDRLRQVRDLDAAGQSFPGRLLVHGLKLALPSSTFHSLSIIPFSS